MREDSPGDPLARAFWPLLGLFAAGAAALSLGHRYLPLCDWPEHLAEASIVRHLHDPAYGFDAYYHTTGWFLPYQTFRWLHIALATLFGDGLGGRVALVSYLAGAPLAAALLLRRLGRDPWLAFAIAPLLVEANLLWGFAPYALGQTLLLLGLALAVDLGRRGGALRFAAVALVGVLLFFTHAQQTALWLAAVGVVTLAERVGWRRAATVAAAVAPAAVLLAVYLVGAGWLSGRVAGVEAGPVLWDTTRARLDRLFIDSGLDATGSTPIYLYFAALACAFAGALLGRGPRRLAAPALAGLYILIALVAPNQARGQSIEPRLVSSVLLFVVWALPMVPRPARLLVPVRLGLVAVAALSLLHLHAYFARFDRSLRPLDAVIDAVPMKSRVATLVFDRFFERPRIPAYLHINGYLLAARGGMAATGFTRTGVDFNPGAAAHRMNEFEPRPLPARQAAYFDYVLVRKGPGYPGSPVEPGLRAQLVAGGGDIELWRIDHGQ